jgi:DNA-binding PadR family transcriptional regulator
MFRITPEGRRLLAALRSDVTELYREVVLDEDDMGPSKRTASRRRTLSKERSTR